MRYLIPFHPKRHPHFFTDILVIGGGLAGLRTALAVDPKFQVLLICKDGLENSNSMHAQGGIAAVWDANDSMDAHIEDTFTAGGNLCERNVVERVVRQGPNEIRKSRLPFSRRIANVPLCSTELSFSVPVSYCLFWAVAL